jgi:hypothetical protein
MIKLIYSYFPETIFLFEKNSVLYPEYCRSAISRFWGFNFLFSILQPVLLLPDDTDNFPIGNLRTENQKYF